MFRRALTVFAIVAGIGSALAPAASAESIPESVDFVAKDGAFPFGGQSGHWVAGPDHEVMIRESGNVLRGDADANGGFDYFALEFTGPGGAHCSPALTTMQAAHTFSPFPEAWAAPMTTPPSPSHASSARPSGSSRWTPR